MTEIETQVGTDEEAARASANGHVETGVEASDNGHRPAGEVTAETVAKVEKVGVVARLAAAAEAKKAKVEASLHRPESGEFTHRQRGGDHLAAAARYIGDRLQLKTWGKILKLAGSIGLSYLVKVPAASAYGVTISAGEAAGKGVAKGAKVAAGAAAGAAVAAGEAAAGAAYAVAGPAINKGAEIIDRTVASSYERGARRYKSRATAAAAAAAEKRGVESEHSGKVASIRETLDQRRAALREAMEADDPYAVFDMLNDRKRAREAAQQAQAARRLAHAAVGAGTEAQKREAAAAAAKAEADRRAALAGARRAKVTARKNGLDDFLVR